MAWIDPDADAAMIADHWPDGAALTPAHLESLLTAAQEQAEAYAPELEDPETVPERYRVAVIFQARDLYEAQQRQGGGDVIGVGDYAIRALPLSSVVKSLLRPQRVVAHFGRRRTTA